MPPRQLHGERRDEGARRLELAAAAREKEAGAQHAGSATAARDGARDGRLVRAGRAIEPEYALRAVAGAVVSAGLAAAAVVVAAVTAAAVAAADGAVGSPHHFGEQLRARAG